MLVILPKKSRQRRVRISGLAICFSASPSRRGRCPRALPARTRSGSGKAAHLLDLLRIERGDVEDLLSFLQADPGEAGGRPGLGARPPARLGGRLAGCSGTRPLSVPPTAESPESPAPPGPPYLRTPAATRGRRRGPPPGRPPGRSAPDTWPAETAAVRLARLAPPRAAPLARRPLTMSAAGTQLRTPAGQHGRKERPFVPEMAMEARRAARAPREAARARATPAAASGTAWEPPRGDPERRLRA